MRRSLSNIVESSTSLHGDEPAAASPQGLADRRELAFVAVERTRMPMVVTDPRQSDNPIVLANQAFLDLTGYAAAEVIGRNCRFLQGPGTSPVAIAQIRAAMLAERDITLELLNYRKDGVPFWNQLHFSPVHDDEGRLLYYFGSQADQTEYRKVQALEAAEHRLLREVDHRALNVLAIVEGIVRLSKSDDPARYAASVQHRVQALARAHTLLADLGWANAPLERLVRQQAGPFGDARVRVDGPPLSVAPRMVQPLALVLHELSANAAVHGGLSVPGGALEISWRELPVPGTLKLSWVERGGPPPSMSRSPGFGEAMVAAIVRRQLKGTLERRWDTAGLQAVLTLPNAWD